MSPYPRGDAGPRGFIPDELRQEIEAFPLDTSLLRATLRGYQVFGAQYAIHQRHAILGDEMGLGKTVETSADAPGRQTPTPRTLADVTASLRFRTYSPTEHAASYSRKVHVKV